MRAAAIDPFAGEVCIATVAFLPVGSMGQAPSRYISQQRGRFSSRCLRESVTMHVSYWASSGLCAGSGPFGEKHMTKSWEDMTHHEKLEMLRRTITQTHATQEAVKTEIDQVWNALRAARTAFEDTTVEVSTLKTLRFELGKILKEVATLRALWPKSYSRTG
jgi:hypothetical protein